MIDPNKEGRFGEFGGRFVPETLLPACEELGPIRRSSANSIGSLPIMGDGLLLLPSATGYLSNWESESF